MIERLLVAERALADGELDRAEQLFRQVAEADERNAIAVAGLAEVARARGDLAAAAELAARALAIDPEDAAAGRLIARANAAPEPSPALEPQAVRSVGRPSPAARLGRWLRRLIGRGS
jgi:thioredoxin-like negative regulator of GroEL